LSGGLVDHLFLLRKRREVVFVSERSGNYRTVSLHMIIHLKAMVTQNAQKNAWNPLPVVMGEDCK